MKPTPLAFRLTLAAAFAGTAVASAQTPIYRGSDGQIQLAPPLTNAAPALDGKLDDEAWKNAVVLGSFTHRQPVEGVRDTLGTECLVMYDKNYLYVGFRAPDDSKLVQAPVVPRDQAGQGDWVGVSIDSYHDQQRSFFIGSNPVGIQMDGVDQEGRDTDMAPDFQYISRGKVNGHGFEVEMAIPFKTLRFANADSVTFGFNAVRRIRRSGTQMFWAPVRRDINSFHTQFGSLEGFTGIRPGRNLEINPTVTGSKVGAYDATADALAYDAADSRFGLGVKVGITSNLIGDATITPDFSQIEADAGALDVNERFAIFYPEKRPFFLEGSDYFNTPLDLVYTRRIVDPGYGAKLTGKTGRTTIGVLQSSDRSAGNPVSGVPDPANPYLDESALFTIARFKQDIFKNSYIGVLGTERRHDDAYNRDASVDGLLRWADKYSLSFQGVGSWSKDQDFRSSGLPPQDLAGMSGETVNGEAWVSEVSRDTRPLSVGANVTGISPDFRADAGFFQRTDIVRYSGWVRPHLWGKEGARFTDIRFPIYYERVYDYAQSQEQDDVLSVVAEADLSHNEWMGTETVNRFVRYNDIAFPRMLRHAVWVGSERFRGVRGGAVYVWGDQIVYAESVYGRDQRYELWSDLRFSSQFDAALSVLGQSLWREDGTRYATVTIPRVRVSYQFTKELALRWITEMRSQRTYDATGTLASDSRTVTPDVLLSYYVRPGTVVYLGYGSELTGSQTDTMRPMQSSFFTKVSYLWRV